MLSYVSGLVFPSTESLISNVFFKNSTTEQQGTPASELPSSSPASGAALSLRTVIHKPFTQSRIPPDLPMHPAPRHITEEELSVLESCLHRWRTEIENDTRGKKLLLVGYCHFR